MKAKKIQNRDFVTIEFPEADIEVIVPSQFKPQQIRSKRFTKQEISEMAKSILAQGILRPLMVRLVDGKLELIDGERRWRGALEAGIKKVPYMLKDYSDKAVAIIQLHANLFHQNPHPLDEAYNYGFMRDDEELKMSPEQIAEELGKDVNHVIKRLKLLDLPEEIREAYERKEITLGHIEEIAKYPKEDHLEVYSYCFSNFGHTSQALYPLPKTKRQIAQFYLLQLSKAPFPLDSDELHDDGKTCLQCNERTGAHPSLFDDPVGEKDSCYNRECYENKVEKFVQIKRVSTATNVYRLPPPQAVFTKQVPVVKSRASEIVTNVPTVKIDEILRVENLQACPFTKVGVGGDGENIGREIYYCSKPETCSIHRPDAPSMEKPKEEEISTKKFEQEEGFQVLVGESVRREVLRQITTKITAKEFGSLNSRFYNDVSDRLMNSLDNTNLMDFLNLNDKTNTKTPSNDLTPDQRAQNLFLLTYVGKCRMVKAYLSQAAIKELAEIFDVDYQMIDAIKRLELSPEQHRKTFYDYLRKIEEDERDMEIPLVFFPEWRNS